MQKRKILKNSSCIDVVIIGGGLAGLVSAIYLSKSGIQVVVIEKHTYPRHKVCGEYLSNEVLPYLQFLNIDLFELGAKKIKRFILSTTNGKTIETKLPLGGCGISRYTLEYYLAQKARENGATIFHDTVLHVKFINDHFQMVTKNQKKYNAKILIGAHGKRSNIDVNLNRNFLKSRAPLLAVKNHLKGDFPDDLVALHNFNGGYCGISKVENNNINACYLTDLKSFQKFKNTEDFQQNVLYKNKYLKDIYENSEPVFSKPLTISQITFLPKKPVEQHILMCGDSAGMIHPLSGNGMSMAIRGAYMVSVLIKSYFNGEINSRATLEKIYEKKWTNEFSNRVKAGHMIALFFRMNIFSEMIMFGLKSFPGLLPKIIKQTHGKPLLAK